MVRSVPLVLQQLIALSVVLLVALMTLKFGTEHLRDAGSTFRGPHWFKNGETLEVSELVVSPFMRVESHTIRFGEEVVADWLWTDVADQVNVLVEDDQGRFLVLQQTKYGLPEVSWAVVGGLIEPFESPLAAAQRELLEELGRETRPDRWLYLGRFRTDANRGGGFVNCFLARHTKPVLTAPGRSDDLEQQNLQVVSREHLIELVLENKFAEVKWTATVALSLLRLQRPNTPLLPLHTIPGDPSLHGVVSNGSTTG